MSSVAADDARRRRRLATGIKDSLRELSNQLSLLNHQVGTARSARARSPAGPACTPPR
jgi:hypothetical protein